MKLDNIEMPVIIFIILCALMAFIGYKAGKASCNLNGSGGSGGYGDDRDDAVIMDGNGFFPADNINSGNGSNNVYDSSIVYGCTDPTALNYYGGASEDDGSCYYEIIV